MTSFVLASASPARLAVLRGAGIEPVVRVSGIDEDALTAKLQGHGDEEVVIALAEAKASKVAADIGTEIPDGVVVGCDSMLRFDGELLGKPDSPADATNRWLRMAGRTGELVTGHAVVRLIAGEIARETSGCQRTSIRFGAPTHAELAAYVASGEPMGVAGAFTLDGLGGWFVEGVTGDPSSVIGISLPLTRRLLAELDISVADLWSTRTVG